MDWPKGLTSRGKLDPREPNLTGLKTIWEALSTT
jgi:hypothetical protein